MYKHLYNLIIHNYNKLSLPDVSTKEAIMHTVKACT